MSSDLDELRRLAREHRVLTRYRDGFKQFREPPPETIVAVLRALGVPIAKPSDAAGALRESRAARWSRLLPPCAVAWEGERPGTQLRLLELDRAGRALCRIDLESGEKQEWTIGLGETELLGAARIDAESYCALRLDLPANLPTGYHRLSVEIGGHSSECALLCAPSGCAPAPPDERSWGVFLPLYALRTGRGDGVGDFTALAELLAWTRSLGGSTAGTLPLLAAYLDDPFEYSPYVPVSRRFWNELYVDPRRTPEWETSSEARAAFDAAGADQAELRASDLVDYRRTAALRRRVLGELSRAAWSDSARAGALESWADQRPELRAYARFRAVVEKRRETWRTWPEPLRAGRLRAEDTDPEAERFHLYAQWAADRQLSAIDGLYLDLPLGTHAGGFDVWRTPGSFAEGVAGGAPPDRFFTQGQNWSFAPLHPEACRAGGHRHFRDCLRHHLERATILRVDHFMGLHRLYWIPEGASGTDGTYVQYPADELYAVLAIESRRAQARIVGEDLGTVPKYVRRRMRKRSIDRMYVAQFSFKPDRRPPLETPPPDSLAGVNTHDTPTFAAFWQGLDVDLQEELALLDAAQAEETRRSRAEMRGEVAAAFGVEPESPAVLRKTLDFLAASPARAVFVNLEDLWDETEPQNTPGTGQERPNWRRRARLDFDEIRTSESVRSTLAAVDKRRREA